MEIRDVRFESIDHDIDNNNSIFDFFNTFTFIQKLQITLIFHRYFSLFRFVSHFVECRIFDNINVNTIVNRICTRLFKKKKKLN